MVGQILDYEAKRIKNAGIEEGHVKGLAEGHSKGATESRTEDIRSLMETMDLSIKQAMDALKISPDEQETYTTLLKNMN